MKRRRTISVALCGVISALSVVVMMMTALVPVASLTLCAIAGMLLSVVVIEFGYKFALSSYFVTVVLSGFFVPDKESVILFALFFGLYPIAKGLFERIRNKPLRWGVKALFFNGMMAAYYALAVWVLLIPIEEFRLMGEAAPYLLLLLGNVIFVLYDIAFTRLITMYLFRIQANLKKRLGL